MYLRIVHRGLLLRSLRLVSKIIYAVFDGGFPRFLTLPHVRDRRSSEYRRENARSFSGRSSFTVVDISYKVGNGGYPPSLFAYSVTYILLSRLLLLHAPRPVYTPLSKVRFSIRLARGFSLATSASYLLDPNETLDVQTLRSDA